MTEVINIKKLSGIPPWPGRLEAFGTSMRHAQAVAEWDQFHSEAEISSGYTAVNAAEGAVNDEINGLLDDLCNTPAQTRDGLIFGWCLAARQPSEADLIAVGGAKAPLKQGRRPCRSWR